MTERPTYPPTLWALLTRRVASTPGQVLLEDDRGRTLRAEELLSQAERVAAGLSSTGVAEGSIVSWQLPTTIESCVLMLALARLGAVQNPILPLLRAREVAFIVAQTRADLLVTPSVWRDFDYAAMATAVSADTGVRHLIADAGGLPSAAPDRLGPSPVLAPGHEPVRHIYYSSGSTADPKGARHTDLSVMSGATGMLVGYEIDEHDCIPVPFPITHIGGMALLVASLYTGCRLLLIERFDPETSPDLMGRRGATLIGSALPFYNAYLAAQERQRDRVLFPQLKVFTGGGAPKPPEIYYRMKEVFGVGIASGYGLTEFPIAASGSLRDSDEDLANTEGRAVPGVDLKVVDANGVTLPAGVEGEIRMKGPQCCVGYVDPAYDADAFDQDGYFRSGDLGVLGTAGHIRITGRLKDVIIRNAENISAQEVENLLFQHPKIADVAVIGLPDPVTGERACAVVVLADGATALTLAEVADFCRSHQLANQKIPERIELVDELPRSGLGKVVKRQLRVTFGAATA